MAKPALLIQFPTPADPALMHRVLNFVEAVDSTARNKGLGAVDNIDNYLSGQFVVSINSSRRLGELLSLVSNLLDKHMLRENAAVSRVNQAVRSKKGAD